jgi:ribose transport system permease protein
LLITDGNPIYGLDKAIGLIGNGMIGPMYISGIIWIFLTIFSTLILRYTTFGRSLYIIGGNTECAYLSGIRVKFNTIIVYVICGIIASFAGIVMCSWLTVAQPTAAVGLELDAIAAAVLGGTSLSGGIGSVTGTFVGVILLAIITNIFNLIGVSSYFQQIFKGIIIICALVANYYVATMQKSTS